MRKIHDHYSRKARAEKYPARSVYKLMEIDKKYRLLKNNIRILDVGCTPGSWTQYALERIGTGRVVGIDPDPGIKINDPRFVFLEGHIESTDPAAVATAADSERPDRVFDLVLSDAAPNTTGNPFGDAQRSLRIVESVFSLSRKMLKAGGSAVVKVFQGEDLDAFLSSLREDYQRVYRFKPKSSRKESREIYIIASRRITE